MGFFDPKWLKIIPSHLRPNNFQIEELEKLRKQFDMSHEYVAGYVMQSPGIVKMMFDQQYAELRRTTPNLDNKQTLESIYQTRTFSDFISAGLSPYEARERLQQEDVQQKIKSKLLHINSVDDLVRLVYRDLKYYEKTPDPLGINKRIEEILGWQR